MPQCQICGEQYATSHLPSTCERIRGIQERERQRVQQTPTPAPVVSRPSAPRASSGKPVVIAIALGAVVVLGLIVAVASSGSSKHAPTAEPSARPGIVIKPRK